MARRIVTALGPATFTLPFNKILHHIIFLSMEFHIYVPIISYENLHSKDLVLLNLMDIKLQYNLDLTIQPLYSKASPQYNEQYSLLQQ